MRYEYSKRKKWKVGKSGKMEVKQVVEGRGNDRKGKGAGMESLVGKLAARQNMRKWEGEKEEEGMKGRGRRKMNGRGTE